MRGSRRRPIFSGGSGRRLRGRACWPRSAPVLLVRVCALSETLGSERASGAGLLGLWCGLCREPVAKTHTGASSATSPSATYVGTWMPNVRNSPVNSAGGVGLSLLPPCRARSACGPAASSARTSSDDGGGGGSPGACTWIRPRGSHRSVRRLRGAVCTGRTSEWAAGSP